MDEKDVAESWEDADAEVRGGGGGGGMNTCSTILGSIVIFATEYILYARGPARSADFTFSPSLAWRSHKRRRAFVLLRECDRIVFTQRGLGVRLGRILPTDPAFWQAAGDSTHCKPKGKA